MRYRGRLRDYPVRGPASSTRKSTDAWLVPFDQEESDSNDYDHRGVGIMYCHVISIGRAVVMFVLSRGMLKSMSQFRGVRC